MAKRRSKEYSLIDYTNLYLSPLISAISGYMYWVTRENRYAFGPLIGEHVSNFFGTALAMYLATALTTGLEKNTELESVKKLAVFMQVSCAVALVGINLHFEVWEGNDQMVGDMAAAIIALAVTWINTRYSFDELSK
ncbi:MAG: hypothetical protein OEX81_04105 [Candidatus Pacebacteria bacterium]|nr:hypothetical protein [Candidatus Paceibacterota bacterium]